MKLNPDNLNSKIENLREEGVRITEICERLNVDRFLMSQYYSKHSTSELKKVKKIAILSPSRLPSLRKDLENMQHIYKLKEEDIDKFIICNQYGYSPILVDSAHTGSIAELKRLIEYYENKEEGVKEEKTTVTEPIGNLSKLKKRTKKSDSFEIIQKGILENKTNSQILKDLRKGFPNTTENKDNRIQMIDFQRSSSDTYEPESLYPNNKLSEEGKEVHQKIIRKHFT